MIRISLFILIKRYKIFLKNVQNLVVFQKFNNFRYIKKLKIVLHIRDGFTSWNRC